MLHGEHRTEHCRAHAAGELQGATWLRTVADHSRKVCYHILHREANLFEVAAHEICDTAAAARAGNHASAKCRQRAEVLFDIYCREVTHHGSKNSTSEEFLQMIDPAIAVISCGKNNRYGHPHEETLERLSEADISWFCTKDYGAITVSVDAKGRVAVKGYRKP